MHILDRVFQPVFNPLNFGPSIFILAKKKGELPEIKEGENAPEITDILACPNCKSEELVVLKPEIRCKNCDRRFPIIDGVYDFRIE